MTNNNSIIMEMMTILHVLNYADAAKTLFIIMYGDSHVPEFDCEKDDNGNVQLIVYMEGKECCRIKRIILCENIITAEDPVNVVYKELEDMHEELKSYKE